MRVEITASLIIDVFIRGKALIRVNSINPPELILIEEHVMFPGKTKSEAILALLAKGSLPLHAERKIGHGARGAEMIIGL